MTLPFEAGDVTERGEITPIYLSQEKLGSQCCGCLCDYRRAVIWANSFFIAYATLLLLSRNSVVQLAQDAFKGTDDEFVDDVTELVDAYYRKRSISLAVALATCLLSQIGVILFWTSLVAIHSLVLVADFVVFCFLALDLYEDMTSTLAEVNMVAASPVLSFVLNGVLTLLFLYPQIGFLIECRLGIMTSETYAREDYCCCCSRKQSQDPHHPHGDPPTLIS